MDASPLEFETSSDSQVAASRDLKIICSIRALLHSYLQSHDLMLEMQDLRTSEAARTEAQRMMAIERDARVASQQQYTMLQQVNLPTISPTPIVFETKTHPMLPKTGTEVEYSGPGSISSHVHHAGAYSAHYAVHVERTAKHISILARVDASYCLQKKRM